MIWEGTDWPTLEVMVVLLLESNEFNPNSLPSVIIDVSWYTNG